MSEPRESIGGFLGSSTIQVRDSSPSGQNDDTVEAMLVPEGEVAFSQESLDEDGVTMQNVQLVGDNLVLMDGDMIVSGESGAILVQNGMFVDPEQIDGQSEHMIAYIPETVPDQDHSLIVEESEAGIQHVEDPIQAEEGMYETNVIVPTDVVSQVEDQQIEEVPPEHQHPDISRTVMVEFDIHQAEIGDADGATYVEVESDGILLQEVPEQTAGEMETLIMEQMGVDAAVPTHDEQLQEMQSLESDANHVPGEQFEQIDAVEEPVLEQEAEAAPLNQPTFQQVFQSAEEQVQYDDVSARNDSDRVTSREARVRDQDLQVVPDGSEIEENKTFLNENLHDSMDGSAERISPVTTSMGMQMVPGSGENSRDTMGLQRNDVLLQDTIYEAQEASQVEEQTGNLSDEPENVVGLENALVWQVEEEQRADEPSEAQESHSEPVVLRQLDSNDDEAENTDRTECSPHNEAPDENLTQIVSCEQSSNGASSAEMVGIPADGIMLVESAGGESMQDVTHVFQVSDMSQADALQKRAAADVEDEQMYEMCIALPDEQDEATPTQNLADGDHGHGYEMCIALPDKEGDATAVDFQQESGTRTITVPITIDGQVQEIPLQIPDWADLSQQSLVAVTEDGTQIPLTFVQEDEDDGNNEVRYAVEDQQQHIEVLLDSEMLSASQQGIALDESELIAIQDGENQFEVVNMEQHEYEIHDGVIRLVQKRNSPPVGGGQILRHMELDSDISPATSVTPFFFDKSGMAIHEQSILPDTPREMTNAINSPGDSYFSTQPIELQVVEVPDGRVLQKPGGRAGAARGMPAHRGPQRKRRPYQRQAPRQPKGAQGAVSIVESQQAVRSIGQHKEPGNQHRAPSRQQPHEVHYVAVQEDRPTAIGDSSQIELSNETPSVISPENMQALIQVLQSLPNNARGQTIQIVLQSDQVPSAATPNQDAARSKIAETATPSEWTPNSAPAIPKQSSMKEQQIQVIHMPSARTSKTTSDIAVQVTPDFLKNNGEIDLATLPQNTNIGAVSLEEGGSAAQKTTTITVLTDDIMPQSCINMLAEDDSFLYGNTAKASKKQKLTGKRKAPKKIVTVEEVQYMIDPKPGVSYYAVVDYMSEHDQDGFSSASEMRRPEAQYLRFMEDHLELQSTSELSKGRSTLESTLDSSLIISPYQNQRRKYQRSAVSKQQGSATIDLPLDSDQTSVTLTERTYEQALLEEELVSEQPPQHMRRRKNRTRALQPLIKHYKHRCGYCEFGSTEKILVVDHCISEHPSQPVKTLSLLPQTIGRMCPYCQQSFDHMEFFAHMRFAHNEVHPFKCGYCEFMGRDRNQVRHHIQKKHRLPMKVINLLDSNRRLEAVDSRLSEGGGKKRIMAYSEGEDTVYEYLTDEEEMEDNDSDNANAKKDLICPECKRTFKTLKYLKTHIKIHQSQRYQCGYCDFISVMLHPVIRHCQKKHIGMAPKVLTKDLDPDKHAIISRDMDTVIEKVFSLNTRLPRDPDATKWMRKWFCPHCDYACQFGASYRRHLRMHANILPYKCNYCSFKGREKYYVRRHIHRMHRDLPMIVVENNPENCARDTSSDEDYQEKGLRRRRRRRTKDAEHAVVPLGDLEDEMLGPHFQKLPVGERGTKRGSRLAIDELENEFPLSNVLQLVEGGGSGYRSRASGMHKLSKSKLWSEENLDDYIKEQIGDMIVCKMCGESTHEKVFHKHARKHFKQRPFKCGYCNYMAMEMSKIRTHNSQKHPGAPLKLEECHLASITPEDFMDLLGGDDSATAGIVQENDPLTAHFECPFCQVTLAYTERCLQEHFYMHYDYYPFKCSECDFQATSEQKVVEHGVEHDVNIVVYQIEMDKPSGLEETIQQFMREGEQIAAQRVNDLLEQSAAPRLGAADDRDGAEESTGLTVSIFQCPMCDQQMTLHEVMVRRHLYEHYDYKPFKCGYCNFQGVSKGIIKRHTANHGPVKPRIGLSEEAMPEDLAKILRHIRSVMKLSPDKMESAVIPEDETIRLAANNEDPLTAEGRRWKEALAQGQCPWCDTKVGGSAKSKLHAHILSHFSTEPFQCGYCDQRFSNRKETRQHAAKCHPDEVPKVVEVVDDEAEMRKGLLQFMKSKRASVGAHNLMKNTTLVETNAPAEGSNETHTTIEDEMKKLIGEVKEFQYQVVIMNEDGTVVETMDVMTQQPITDVGCDDAVAIDVAMSPINEDAEGATDVNVKTADGDDQRPNADAAGENVELANPGGKSGNAEGDLVAGGVEAGEKVEPEPQRAEAVIGSAETEDKNVEAGSAVVQAQDQIEAAKFKPPEAVVGKDAELDVTQEQGAEIQEQNDFDADIVTVDRVLLTRSFRSETEDSGEDDNPMGSIMSPPGSSNESVNSDEDDDDDEMLAIGPSLEFMGDIISLLKNSSAELQASKPSKVYKFMCQHCGVTFPKSAMLQKHISKEHERNDDATKFQCDRCGFRDEDVENVRTHAWLAHASATTDEASGSTQEMPQMLPMELQIPMTDQEEPQTSAAVAPGLDVPARGQKRVASDSLAHQEEKRSKASPVFPQTSATPVQGVLMGGQKRRAPVDECEVQAKKIAKLNLEIQESDSTITDERDAPVVSVAVDDAHSLHVASDDKPEEEETIENITRMVQEGQAQDHGTVDTVHRGDESGPNKDSVADGVEMAAKDAGNPSNNVTGEDSVAHKSAPSRLEASKLKNLEKMLEQEPALVLCVPIATNELVPVSGAATTAIAEKDAVPLTMAEEPSPQQQDPNGASTTSKPSRLEAYKLEALKRAQSMASGTRLGERPAPKTAKETKISSPKSSGASKISERKVVLPAKPIRKSSRVIRLSRRARGLPDSVRPAGVQVGKYRLRGKARKDKALPAPSKAKAGKAPTATAKLSAKVEICTTKTGSSSAKSKTETDEGEATRKRPELKEGEALGSQGEDAAGTSAERDTDEGLEGLENLEECDENLPKILQILQLRPTKDSEKA